jgi:hypothetical protein
MDAFMYNLKRFIDVFGDDGKSELNTVCSKHQLVIAPQDTTKFSYGGLDIKDGVLRLVFQEERLGTNVSDVSAEIAKALKDAPPAPGASAFNIVARNSVRDNYDPKVEEVRSAIATLVNMPSLKLNPNFDHNSSMLAKTASDHETWDRQIGAATLDYFSSVESALKREGFGGDDMLQEGFQDVVSKGEICFRIVDKLNKGTYNEVHAEDGVLYVQVRQSLQTLWVHRRNMELTSLCRQPRTTGIPTPATRLRNLWICCRQWMFLKGYLPVFVGSCRITCGLLSGTKAHAEEGIEQHEI